MIKVKAGELHDIFASLKILMDIRLPIEISFQIGRFFREIVKELNIYERSRMNLVDQCGEKDEMGQLILENDSYRIRNKTKFNKEFEKLQNIDIEIDINQMELHLKNIEIAPLGMIALQLIAKNDDIIELKEQNDDQRDT